ncbi:glycine betaine/L-proline ABC transporter substrate-binding protein ProX [Tianweitania sp. BSSL-BM11]|uniref:Glycine betaine/L-proline ABC transporter substrate-binding protein ProX n=1 Tax=Tianweitania aestuarii TaxID=2814886 RepID=A0ABS5RTQ7_9HYPH|nr:glycine betaine/L-proline ABC transporter substrate-binding protein ProX [Tianweitania aestuarii]MBS9719671.1 glycine betaine/L-proline ABC transporter substrate-binding protein ProX [Tianweitania aestuarii]
MKTSHLPRLLALALSTSALLGVPAAYAQDGEPGAGTTVRMAQATWDTGWFHAEIYKQLLEKLGYSVDGPTTLDNPPFYQAVGQGDLDLWVNGWFPLHNSYESAYSQGAELVGTVAKGGALEGYLVDKASVEKYNIKTLDDFKREDVQKAFDRDGDGKADLVACPPGWGCELTIEHHLDAYELRDHINPIKAAYSASMADAVAAHQQGNPILFYTWTPNWTVNALKPGEDVMWIEVPRVDLPEAQKDLEESATLPGVPGCVEDPCRLGFPANDIRPVANSEFLKENPSAKALLEEVSIPIDDIFAQNAKMNAGEGKSEDVKRHASEWIAAHEDEVNGWLETARAAKQ